MRVLVSWRWSQQVRPARPLRRVPSLQSICRSGIRCCTSQDRPTRLIVPVTRTIGAIGEVNYQRVFFKEYGGDNETRVFVGVRTAIR